MVRLTDRPDMTLDVYRGRKTTIQQLQIFNHFLFNQAHPRVAQKLKFLIRTWAEMKEFKDDPSLR